MTLTQMGVAKGALSAITLTLISFAATYYLAIKGTVLNIELPTVIGIASLPLLYCIGRIANKRYVSEETIDGSAYDVPGSTLAVDKALLQNTLEQTILLFGTYILISSTILGFLLETALILFVIGRILFIAGYKYGAGGRAFGFGLTMYPTTLLLLGGLVCSYFF